MRCFTAGLLFALLGVDGIAKAADESAGQFITLELVVADAPEGTPATPTAAAILELEKGGKLTSFARYRLTALENQQSSIQFRELAPLMTGRTSFRGPEGASSAPTFNQMAVGTMISAVSRLEADGSIVSDLQFERSQVTPRRPPEGGDPAAFVPQGTTSVNVKTTVRAKLGEPLLVGGRQQGSGKDAAQTWLVLTASVAPRSGGEKPAAATAAGPIEELKIVQLKHASAPALASVLTSVFQREPLRIAVDERTNSLLIRASPSRLDTVLALVARLDES